MFAVPNMIFFSGRRDSRFRVRFRRFVHRPTDQPNLKKKRSFKIHRFLREAKIVLVDSAGIIMLAIWLYHEIVGAVVAR